MARVRHLTSLLIALLALGTAASAQDVLTLDAAVAEALARNAGLAAARAGEAEAAARVGQAQSGYLPRLTLSESWQRGNAPVFVFSSLLSARRFAAGNFAVDALNHPPATGFFHGAVAVEQIVFDGGRTRAGVRASRDLAVMASASRAEQEHLLASRVADSYGRLLTFEAAGRAAAAAIAAATEDLTRAERRRDAGRVTDADVLALRVHVAAMRQRAIDASGQAAVTRAEINRLRGRPVETPFAVQEPAPSFAGAARDWTAMADEALRGRPDVQRAQAAVSLADAGRREARAAWWPQVAAQGTYQFDGTSATRRASAWVVGGEARWTFQTGLGDRATSKAAAAAAQRARALLEDQRAAVQVEVLSAVRRVESAEAREGVALAAVAQARESERILRDRYDAGLVSVQDVLAAAASVMAAETLRIEAVADRISAAADLARARGHR